MIEYLIGRVSYTNDKFIILENNFIGYKIWMNKTSEIDDSVTNRIYVFIKTTNNSKNYQISEIYGFKTYKEKNFFETLISATGIGPKTALLIMQNNIELLKELISKKNINDLENLPNFSKRLAINLCNQLSYKIFVSKKENTSVDNNDLNTSVSIEEIVSALKSLGYKKEEINLAISTIDLDTLKDVNVAISEAIKNIVNGNDEYIPTKA
ncbi:MAG: Holliday junction branch migration protein RuvA [Malacoplasma sp.]